LPGYCLQYTISRMGGRGDAETAEPAGPSAIGAPVPERWAELDHAQRAAAHYNAAAFYLGFATFQRRAFRGEVLRVGQPAPPFSLATVDGATVTLDELRDGRYVALVFGSASAGPVLRDMPAIEELFRSWDPGSATMAFVYTREAHPNEPIESGVEGHVLAHHRSMEQKVQQARAFRDSFELSMPVLVDDLAGTTDRAYANLPFFQVVVDPDGIMVHRADWADVDLLAATYQNIRRAERWTAEGRPRHWRGSAYSESIWLR
jgi:hypothetical protein